MNCMDLKFKVSIYINPYKHIYASLYITNIHTYTCLLYPFWLPNGDRVKDLKF